MLSLYSQAYKCAYNSNTLQDVTFASLLDVTSKDSVTVMTIITTRVMKKIVKRVPKNLELENMNYNLMWNCLYSFVVFHTLLA